MTLLLAACNTTPIRDITASSTATPQTEEEQRLWLASSRLNKQIRRQELIYRDETLRSYVESIGKKLYPELADALKFQLLNSPELNAFVLPNGSIYINIGLLARLDNEAQMATILAHEVSHFTRQHSVRQQRNSNSSSVAALGVTLITGIPLSGQLFAATAITGYSRELEKEADLLGFERMQTAGYATTESVKTFEHLLAEVKALEIDRPLFFSSHPRLEERIKSFNQLIDEMAPHNGATHEERYLERTAKLRAEILERYLSLQQYKTLILMLGKNEQIDHYPAYWPYFLGEAYRLRNEEGDLEAARQAFNRALSQAPDFARSHKGLGLLDMKQDDKPAAISHFQRYLEMAPDTKDRTYIEKYIASLKEKD
ncbi:MAG: M48 family metalloprotease [Sedimenticola sp.]